MPVVPRKIHLLVLSLGLAAVLPLPALAASNTTLGVGSGAVAGALVAGPVGAVAGAIVGGVVGASTERAPRRYRRARTRASAVAPRRVVQRAATPARTVIPVSTGSATSRAWTDPR